MKVCLMCALAVLTLCMFAIPRASAAPEPARAETPVLRQWQALHYGMFIHFGMSTFAVDEYGHKPEPSTAYAPTHLDVDQWIRTARDAGMKYAVLTTKHCYGHCLWPSKYTDYTVATSSNKTDVVGAFVKACHKYKIKPGFYYLLGWDMHHQPKMSYAEYEKFVENQITELLSNYGPIEEMWFDIPWDLGPDTKGALSRIYALVKRLQPNCLVLLNQGFVDGSRVEWRRPSWLRRDVSKTLIPLWPKDLIDGERIPPPSPRHNPHIAFEGTTYYLPMETCDTILQKRWFWGARDEVRPARIMYEGYKQVVGRGANFLLNVPPDQSGRIPWGEVRMLRELHKMIEHPDQVRDSLCWNRPAKASNVYKNDPRFGPEKAIDIDVGRYSGSRWATDNDVKTAWLEVDLDGPHKISSAFLSEHLHRIRGFAIQIPDGAGGWKDICCGTRVGESLTLKWKPVKTDRVRLLITKATAGPTLWDFEVYQ